MSAYTKLYVNSCNDTVVMMSFLTFFHYSPRFKKGKSKIELFNDQPQPQTIIGLDWSGPASVHIHWFTTFPLLLNNFLIRYVCLREWAMCGAVRQFFCKLFVYFLFFINLIINIFVKLIKWINKLYEVGPNANWTDINMMTKVWKKNTFVMFGKLPRF